MRRMVWACAGRIYHIVGNLMLWFIYFCLLDFVFVYVQVINFSVIMGWALLGWISTKQGLMCLAQGHKAVTPVRSGQKNLSRGLPFCTIRLAYWWQMGIRECSGSVVECLTWDRSPAGSRLDGVTALCSWARHTNPSLVLVQPRKTHPDINEKLLTGT